jgi:phospholipid/cholesterol/gamma-HCH transport system substrate-binding protein
MKYEIKIAILAIVTMALSFWGFTFIKGKNLLSSSTVLFVEYNDVDMMLPSSPVLKNGFQIGTVVELFLKPGNPEIIVAKLDIRKEIKVPKNAKAVILTTGIMGGKAVALEFNTDCSGDNCAKTGDYLEGNSKGMLGSMMDPEELQEYTNALSEGLKKVFDELNQQLTDPNSDQLIAKTMNDLQKTMANLSNATQRLDGLLAGTSNNLRLTSANIEVLTRSLASNTSTIDSILSNANKISGDISEGVVDEAKGTLQAIQQTIQALNPTLTDLNSLITKINEGEGTLGKIISEDSLYTNISELTQQLDSVLNDIQIRPYRYIPFKSRNKVLKYDRKDAGQ